MEPVINPSFFYWANVAEGAKYFLLVAGVLCAAFGCVSAFCTAAAGEDPKAWIRLSVFGLLVVFIFVFIPTRDTLYQMATARAITPDNLEKGADAVREAIDYIFEKIVEVNK